jgi:inosine-uridine nucleoside N-ribohydrolase
MKKALIFSTVPANRFVSGVVPPAQSELTVKSLNSTMAVAILVTLLLIVPQPEPVKILFDTDMDTDCDDAGALAMLHALADRDEVDILGTMVSSRYQHSAPTVDAINTYYNRPDLPIGVPKGEGATLDRNYRYPEPIASSFPQDIGSNDRAPDAVDLYRKILSRQPDTSVVIVTVGYLTNIRHLLESKGDERSSLTGKELVRRKVKRWIVMGGRYPENMEHGNYGNFMPDPESAVVATSHFPRPIVFSGLGESVMTGHSLARTPSDNPVRRAYELYLENLEKQRPSWDQVALLYAARPTAQLWREVRQGYNRLYDDGRNQWREMPDSDQVLLKLRSDPDDVATVIESLMTHLPQ